MNMEIMGVWSCRTPWSPKCYLPIRINGKDHYCLNISWKDEDPWRMTIYRYNDDGEYEFFIGDLFHLFNIYLKKDELDKAEEESIKCAKKLFESMYDKKCLKCNRRGIHKVQSDSGVRINLCDKHYIEFLEQTVKFLWQRLNEIESQARFARRSTQMLLKKALPDHSWF